MEAKANEFSGPVVSSAHLAAGAMPALSEFEFSTIMLSHAFERWIIRCMAAAGVSDMSPVDVMVLHTVHHRSKAKRLADICLVLNIEDTHVVSYPIKKLKVLKKEDATLLFQSLTGVSEKERCISVSDTSLVEEATRDYLNRLR